MLDSLGETILQNEFIDLEEGQSLKISHFLSLLEIRLSSLLELLLLGYFLLVVDRRLIDDITRIKLQFGCFERYDE